MGLYWSQWYQLKPNAQTGICWKYTSYSQLKPFDQTGKHTSQPMDLYWSQWYHLNPIAQSGSCWKYTSYSQLKPLNKLVRIPVSQWVYTGVSGTS